MTLTFRTLDLDTGSFVSDLASIQDPKVNIEYPDGYGSLQFKYPKNGVAADTLVNDLEVIAYYNDVEIDNGRFVLRGLSGESITETDDTLSCTGLSILDVLRKVIVYADTQFTSATPGKILRDLRATAVARGAWGASAITMTSFSDSLDSDSVAWSQVLNVKYDAGTTYLSIVRSLASRGFIDVRMVGRALHVYNGTTYGDTLDIVLAGAKDLSESPFKKSTEDRFSHVLVKGDDGILVSRTGTGPRREEAYLAQSGISDTGTLAIIGDSFLESSQIEREQRTVKLAANTTIVPGVDFKVGDWVILDTGESPELVRCRQIVLELNRNMHLEASVILNDRILEGEIKRAHQLAAVAGGTSGDGGAIGTPAPPTDATDVLAPKPPTGLGVSSATYLSADGWPRAAMTINWVAPTQNADDSPLTDLSHYLVYVRDGADTDPAFIWRVEGTTAYVSTLFVNHQYFVSVRAVDRNNNASVPTAEVEHITADDTTPPPAPSDPIVADYLGQIRIEWDGEDLNGSPMPGDFAHVQVHVSTVNDFTPSAATQIDLLIGAGISIATDLVYGTPYFVKFVAVDRTGNESAASDQASATPTRVTGVDLEKGIIGYDEIAFKQAGNQIPDGSFETQAYRDRVGAQISGGQWTWQTDSNTNHGHAYLRGVGTVNPSTVREFKLLHGAYGDATAPVADAMRVIPDAIFLFRTAIRSTGADGSAGIRLKWYDRDGTFMSNSDVVRGSTVGFWQTLSGYVTVPAFAAWAVPCVILLSTNATGTWDFDATEFREAMSTLLVVDAAITNAKIANLAVDDAKVANLAVGKLTAGALTADVTISGRFATALTGQRMEINSTGLHAFNSGGTETVRIQNTGSAFFMGEIYSGLPNTKRIRIDATATFNNEAGITFERGTGSDDFQPTVFAHYNTFDGASGGGLHMMSAEATGNSSGRARLSLFRGGNWRLGTEWGSVGQGNGELHAGNMYIYAANHYDDAILASQSYFIILTSDTSNTVGTTVTYGPTMLTSPSIWLQNYDNILTRQTLTASSATSVTAAWDSTLASWNWLGIRRN